MKRKKRFTLLGKIGLIIFIPTLFLFLYIWSVLLFPFASSSIITVGLFAVEEVENIMQYTLFCLLVSLAMIFIGRRRIQTHKTDVNTFK